MRKKIFTFYLTALISAVLFASLITAYGTEPELRIVHNEFLDSPPPDVRVLPNGIMILTGISNQYWSGGGWDGYVVQEYRMVMRPPELGGMVTGEGYGVFEGSVDGKYGTVRYRLKNVIPGGVFEDGQGTISLLKGTGELAGLKGQGTLDFVNGNSEIYMHFEPS